MTRKEVIDFTLWSISENNPSHTVNSSIVPGEDSLWVFFPDEEHCVMSYSVDLSVPNDCYITITMWCDDVRSENLCQEFTDIEEEVLCTDLEEAKALFSDWYTYLEYTGQLSI